ncbi:MAG: hypothetical protein HWN81_11990 [Candidatus Lokiarchaeota archaeon]|nr:hypothetical protein [Candidatus Lokiarchaeota archaeon]
MEKNKLLELKEIKRAICSYPYYFFRSKFCTSSSFKELYCEELLNHSNSNIESLINISKKHLDKLSNNLDILDDDANSLLNIKHN